MIRDMCRDQKPPFILGNSLCNIENSFQEFQKRDYSNIPARLGEIQCPSKKNENLKWKSLLYLGYKGLN